MKAAKFVLFLILIQRERNSLSAFLKFKHSFREAYLRVRGVSKVVLALC